MTHGSSSSSGTRAATDASIRRCPCPCPCRTHARTRAHTRRTRNGDQVHVLSRLELHVHGVPYVHDVILAKGAWAPRSQLTRRDGGRRRTVCTRFTIQHRVGLSKPLRITWIPAENETIRGKDRCWSGTGLQSPFSDSALHCHLQLTETGTET